ncbi:MAG: helicase-related protein [Pseudomonadota bacterium]
MDARYADFLASKAPTVLASGIEPNAPSENLFDFQQACVDFAVRQGRAGLYLDTGLGKTRCQIEWADQCAKASNGSALILTPLAVAKQIEREGRALGYDCRVIRDQSEARSGINICNYDRIDKIEPAAFDVVSLDESSILKSFGGKTTAALTDAFSRHRFRMCATATPAPNDHMELGNQAQFLGLMTAQEMLMRWFKNDTATASQQWRLKGHAEQDFWNWMAGWSRMAQSPEDLGFDGARYQLPPLNVIRHRAIGSNIKPMEGSLFAGDVSATNMHDLKRQTVEARADAVAELANGQEPWIVWCDTDYEADALVKRIPDSVEVRGSMPIDRKEENLEAFSLGQARVIITKPSVAGYGLNWQHCSNMAFAGRTFSYELWYQAVRRSWRFGQTKPVNVHIIVAEGEDQIGRVIDRKAKDHTSMKLAMASAMKRAGSSKANVKVPYNPTFKGSVPAWLTA